MLNTTRPAVPRPAWVRIDGTAAMRNIITTSSTTAPNVSASALLRFFYEALRFGLIAGDVDPGDECSHAARRAPQGNRDRDQERDRNARATGAANRRDLLLDKLLYLVRERLPEVVDLTLNVGWLGDQTVHCDDHDQGRYERQERVESNPADTSVRLCSRKRTGSCRAICFAAP